LATFPFKRRSFGRGGEKGEKEEVNLLLFHPRKRGKRNVGWQEEGRGSRHLHPLIGGGKRKGGDIVSLHRGTKVEGGGGGGEMHLILSTWEGERREFHKSFSERKRRKKEDSSRLERGKEKGERDTPPVPPKETFSFRGGGGGGLSRQERTRKEGVSFSTSRRNPWQEKAKIGIVGGRKGREKVFFLSGKGGEEGCPST